MKILHLRFKNLNSLAGLWEIDFRHPDYVSSGIFAITGPTGAGKTTILDAICLALYGQTPRLSRITQSENEIMSRQSGECFAEVEFETAKGRFRCHWSQHRSRKLADGQLQSPKHEIAEAESGMILESKLKTVAGKVEEVTGMDFERFTRSMLLAQGGFAAFLQARPDERAPILEQITGTAIYSRISIKVHERTSEERKRLSDMRGELDGIQLLSSAEMEALLTEKAELQRSESALCVDALVIREAQAWLERIAALEVEIRQLEQARHDFEIRKTAADPDLARFALAGRALKLSGGHAALLSIRAQQQGEQGALAAAAQRLPQLQADWQAAFDILEQHESQLALAGSVQAEGAELIRITRAFDVKLGEAHTQLQGLVYEIEKTGRQNGDYRLTITDCLQRLAGSEVEQQAVSAFLAEHLADAGLAEALTGIGQQLKSVKILDKRRSETTDKLERHVALINSAAQQLDQAELAWQETQRSVAKGEQSVTELHGVSAELLQGRDLTEWRTAAEALAGRQGRLVTVGEALARVAEVTNKLAELKLRLQELEQKRKTFLERDQTLTAECELREHIAARLQDNVVLLGRVRSLEEQRKQLVDGAPCPLCGSAEHPYAAGNIPQLDDAERELGLAVAAAKAARDQLAGIKLEQVALDKDLQQASHDQAELQQRQLSDAALCTGAVAELGMVIKLDVMVDALAWLELIGQKSEACRVELANERGVIVAAEQHEQQERAAQLSLNKLKDELAELDKIRLTARLGQENGLVERQRLESESANFNNEFERTLAEVAYAVAAYGCLEVVPDSVDELLAGLTIRRNAYAQHLQSRERLEKERFDIAAEADKQRALLAESEKACVGKEQQLRDRTAQRDRLLEQRLEMYGERNPDVEEKLLADALRQAGEQREGALRELHRLQNELGGLKGEAERLTLSVTQRTVLLSELEAAFSLRLSEAGFEDEAVFLQACLPQQRFEELTHMADKLRQDETALQTRQQDRAEALSGELAKELTNKPLELIRDENSAVSEQLSQLQKMLGGIEQRLCQHAEQQQRHQSRLQAFEIQKRECERWERLHSLIGSGDGKKFRNFAQGLTFELMVAHANRQLQKMSDRYILVRDGSEPLELNVIDNYQAGEIRSTKNLSGGESFIASLALSLGLSSMASRNVRVDSLFLDEGFGTLDEDALETALETLSGLQQEGKLIGIISHVPALKERIGTQIQVEAGSAGRSRLIGPGCRQL